MRDTWAGRCQRCGKRVGAYTMSFFNTELICFDCVARERAHPQYAAAHAAELAAVERGDFNFPGTGCPNDLYQNYSNESDEE